MVKQHTKFEDTSFILSQGIIQKQKNIKNKFKASVALKNRSRSTIDHYILVSNMVEQQVKQS